jgi:hypothetical protein
MLTYDEKPMLKNSTTYVVEEFIEKWATPVPAGLGNTSFADGTILLDHLAPILSHEKTNELILIKGKGISPEKAAVIRHRRPETPVSSARHQVPIAQSNRPGAFQRRSTGTAITDGGGCENPLHGSTCEQDSSFARVRG